MKRRSVSRICACAAFAFACAPWVAFAQPAGVEAKADAVLRAMTAAMAGLKQFSAQTENSLEVVTTDGPKIQFVAPATVTVSRPDKLRAGAAATVPTVVLLRRQVDDAVHAGGRRFAAVAGAADTVDAMLDLRAHQARRASRPARFSSTPALVGGDEGHEVGQDVFLQVVGGHAATPLRPSRADVRLAAVESVQWQLDPWPCRYVITTERKFAGAPQGHRCRAEKVARRAEGIEARTCSASFRRPARRRSSSCRSARRAELT